jgi:predicted nucleic acid-binding protein
MTEVFADTGYWIGLLNRRDHLHGKVVEVMRGLRATRVVTSEMVFTEFLNGASDDDNLRSVAAGLVEQVRELGRVTVLPQTTEQFDAALQRYRKSSDKSWSLTDCASFLIMEERGIQAALTHDRHFAQAGFETLLR